MSQIYVTHNINQNLDLRILTFITDEISHMDKRVDYLQVFDLEDEILTHSSEQPEYRKIYPLGRKYGDCKIFAIRTEEEKRSYWTIMYSEEY